MIEEIRDARDRLVCKGDASSGMIIVKQKETVHRTLLAVGQEYIIERGDALTVIKRESIDGFKVRNYSRSLTIE